MATSSKQVAEGPPLRPAQAFTYPPASSESAGKAEQLAGTDATNLWEASTGPKSAAEATKNEQKERQIWQRGFEEGSARSQAAYEKSLAMQREQIGKAVVDFVEQRDRYFQKVEEQVVRLALAIAQKILHREAQMDPLLLTGIVHVALEKLGTETHTRLRTNPADVVAWRAYFARADEDLPTPELVGDPELPLGRCLLETDLGSTEISLETQLKEIEHGFFDLLAQRPGGPVETPAGIFAGTP
jgi:flagellar assembly protein FliH